MYILLSLLYGGSHFRRFMANSASRSTGVSWSFVKPNIRLIAGIWLLLAAVLIFVMIAFAFLTDVVIGYPNIARLVPFVFLVIQAAFVGAGVAWVWVYYFGTRNLERFKTVADLLDGIQPSPALFLINQLVFVLAAILFIVWVNPF
jgi:cytochrome b subunit of formate dehydrogenase